MSLSKDIALFLYNKATDFERAYFEDFVIKNLGYDFFENNKFLIYKLRDLDDIYYIYPNWISPTEAYKLFKEAGVEKYNEFNINYILEINKLFKNILVKPGREGSVVLYIKGIKAEDLEEYKDKFKIDELTDTNLNGEEVVRVWWD